MPVNRYALLTVFVFCSLIGEEICPILVDVPQQRADEVPIEAVCCSDDTFVEGYLQALVDMHFHEYRVRVRVEGDVVFLSNLPANCLMVRSIVSFVEDFPGVCAVVCEDRCNRWPGDYCCDPPCAPHCGVKGLWFPQAQELFAPLVADPRQIRFSSGWRFHDDVFMTAVASATFGDTFPIYRWLDVGCWHGDLQIGIEAGVWAVFQFEKDPYAHEDGDDVALINADYYVGFPLTYAACDWSFRLRIYHISSHLGDEFMISHKDIRRVNPSWEAIDFFASYQITPAIRLYVGPGVNYHSNRTFYIDPLYIEYGLEVRSFGRRIFCQQLYLQPFYAMHISNWQARNWNFDATYVAGFELSRLQGVGRKIRGYVEYHDGFSEEGQFLKMRTKYLALSLSWGY
jgi:Protein of unknown function (DUF1207)